MVSWETMNFRSVIILQILQPYCLTAGSGVYLARRWKESLKKANAVDAKLSSMRCLSGLLMGLMPTETSGTAKGAAERIDFSEALKNPRFYSDKQLEFARLAFT